MTNQEILARQLSSMVEGSEEGILDITLTFAMFLHSLRAKYQVQPREILDRIARDYDESLRVMQVSTGQHLKLVPRPEDGEP